MYAICMLYVCRIISNILIISDLYEIYVYMYANYYYNEQYNYMNY